MHLVLRRASVRFALTGKRFSDSIPGLPQSKGRAILQQCFPLPDALFLHLLRGVSALPELIPLTASGRPVPPSPAR